MTSSEEAAAAAAAALVVDDGVEAPEGASGAETTEEAFEFPTFETEVPRELLAELEEDDTDLTVSDEELDRLSEETGEENQDVLRRLAAAEKRASHFEKLRADEAKKNWAEEAKQFFPLSEPFLDEIQATSRRGYLRTAKNVHERMKPLVEEKVIKPAREAIEAEKAKAVSEVRQEAKETWGEAVVEDQPVVVPEAAQAERARRNRGELSDTIRSMLFPKGS